MKTNATSDRSPIVVWPVLFMFLCGCAGLPRISDDAVVFIGGKSLRYQATAPAASDPTGASDPILVKERPVILKHLKRVIVVKKSRLSEGGTVKISVYDFHGQLLGSTDEIQTDVPGIFLLESTRRIFVGQSSAHAEVDGSVLLDADGRLVGRLPHSGAVGSFGHSDDGQLIWVVANIFVAGRKIGEVKVFDASGALVVNRVFSEERDTISIAHRGRTYNIRVEMPHHP
jgi:hypothetical protein